MKTSLTDKMDCKWRVQSFSRYKPYARCIAYIDARQVMDRLDEVVGKDNWQDKYKEIGGKIFAGIGIKTIYRDSEDTVEWVWKWDIGTETQVEKNKGEVSDAFKRAAVKWGVGRFLYAMKPQLVDTDGAWDGGSKKPNVIDKVTGEVVYDLTEHINNKNKKNEKN